MQYSEEELAYIYQKTNGYCYHCGRKIAWINYAQLGARGAWEVDHSNPKSKGGTNYFRNLVPSCISCNRSKGNAHSGTYRRRIGGLDREPWDW